MTVNTKALDEAQYLATFREPMRDITGTEREDVVDIWSYFDSLPTEDWQGFSAADDGVVHQVYRSGDGRYGHVLIATTAAEVFMVLMVDLEQRAVYGHRLLDLPKLYGLRD
jgi:hypothetical protein